MYKLRSMVTDCEKNEAEWTPPDDCRITKVGRFIRRTRLDEIPQFFNVLKGDMSIIGPRPEVPELTIKFSEKYPNFAARLCVRPGITGWAQVNGGYDLTPEQKLELDIYYINHRNIRMYLLIIIKTFKVIFTGEGAR
jgi:lipopolysaccharide/colanic/teichoic acid biosynthesis glycosyltransferase